MQCCSFLVCFFLTLGATSWAQGDQKNADEQDDFELVQTRRLKIDTSTADEELGCRKKLCGARPEPWTTKCSWKKCNGCGDCNKVNPTAAPKPEPEPQPTTKTETTLTSGTHFLDNRPEQDIIVLVPAGDGPLPVFIALHGAGGLSDKFCTQFQDTPGHIVVCPKRNTQDDLVFVGKELLNWLADFSNVDPTSFKLAGYSQGGDSTNRIAIGNDDPRITHLVTFCSQLHVRQYNSGHFWTEEGEITKKEQIHGRKLLQFTGLRDTRCLCCDASKETCGGKLVTWEESAYRYAQAWGYTGSQMTPVETDDSFSVSYLDGQVQAFNIKKAAHSVKGSSQQWARLAPDFFGTTGAKLPK